MKRLKKALTEEAEYLLLAASTREDWHVDTSEVQNQALNSYTACQQGKQMCVSCMHK